MYLVRIFFIYIQHLSLGLFCLLSCLASYSTGEFGSDYVSTPISYGRCLSPLVEENHPCGSYLQDTVTYYVIFSADLIVIGIAVGGCSISYYLLGRRVELASALEI